MAIQADVAAMLIRKLQITGPLSEVECQAIMELPIIIRRISRNQDLDDYYERQSHCCFVLDGWAFRYKLFTEGRRQIFSFHIAGDISDLQGLYAPVMDYGVCALTSVTTAFMPRERLRELTTIFSGIAAALWRDIIVDSAVSRAWMASMGRRTACEAPAHLFCELYIRLAAFGMAAEQCCRLPLSQSDLGDALGLSNVHINCTLMDLRTRNLISLKRRDLQILDWPRLVQTCDFDQEYLQLSRQEL